MILYSSFIELHKQTDISFFKIFIYDKWLLFAQK